MPLNPDPIASLEALLNAAAQGEPASAQVVRAMQPTGVMGALAQMPLTEVLQNMDFGKRSVRVDVWVADASGTVHVHDGQIVLATVTTAAGVTEGESAVLELCRRPGGFFRIQYVREAVERNVYRPTTFVLLEALRVIDEASTPKGSAPAAVDLGLDPWGETTSAQPFPSLAENDEPSNPFNDPSAVLDIEVLSETVPVQQHPRFRAEVTIDVIVSGAVQQLFLEDIGRGGAFIRTQAPPARGTVVTLRLRASDGALEVVARVVHVLDQRAAASVSREPGVGVELEPLAADAARRFGAFVDDLAAQRAGAHGAKASTPRERLLGLIAQSEFLVAAGDLESAQRGLSQAQGLAPDDDEVRRKLLSVNEMIDAAQANAFLEQALRGGPKAVELAQGDAAATRARRAPAIARGVCARRGSRRGRRRRRAAPRARLR